MTDYTDLIRRLEERDAGCANTDNIYRRSLDAIKELVADYKGQGEALIHEVNAKLEAQVRAEKSEADLSAARAALRYFVDSLSEFHGGEHHDDECPDCRAMVEHAPAIAAARAEGGE